MDDKHALPGCSAIEEAILALQQEPTPELLAHALTVLRRQARDGAQLYVALDPTSGNGELRLGTVSTSDGRKWFAAFTSTEEQSLGGGAVLSAFTADLSRLLELALTEKQVAGLIIDPYRRTLMLDKHLIGITLGTGVKP